MKGVISFIFIVLIGFVNPLYARNSAVLKILILSGENNHKWEETTPFLEKLYTGSGLFEVEITNKPDTLIYNDLKKFDIVLSNWNSFPDNEFRWPQKTEKALVKFIRKGGGFVTFHASTTAFYTWGEFGEFTTAGWGEKTWHGQNSDTHVIIEDCNHPVTNGLAGFTSFDELWVNAAQNKKFRILATATNEKLKEDGIKNQPAVMVLKYGKGRVFHTILGHDVRAMQAAGFKSLMLRGAEWAATGKVRKAHGK